MRAARDCLGCEGPIEMFKNMKAVMIAVSEAARLRIEGVHPVSPLVACSAAPPDKIRAQYSL
jgi:hypothetical protein